MELAATFVLPLAAMTSRLLAPFNVQFLRILAFILVIAATVEFIAVLYQILGGLPLITTNRTVLGVVIYPTECL